MTRPLAVVVLAAGLGTRMKSRVPKMLHEAAGRPLLEHVLRAVQPLAPDKILVVVGHGAGAVRERFAAYPATFVVQEEQLGTGHALLQCRPELADFGGEVLVVNGDMPLLTTETLQALLARQHETRAAMSLVTCEVAEPDGLGRIVRKADGSVAAIVEEKDAGPRERAIREINPGAYLFGPDVFKRIQELSNDNAQGEYYITDLVEIYLRSGGNVQAVPARDELPLLVGVNNRQQLATADRLLRERVRARWLATGVSMIGPELIFIDDGVTLARDVLLHPGVILRGATTVEEGAIIGPYSVLEDVQVAAHAVVPPHTVQQGGCLT